VMLTGPVHEVGLADARVVSWERLSAPAPEPAV